MLITVYLYSIYKLIVHYMQMVVRLNRLQICTSAESTLHKVDECAQGHDKKVKDWISDQLEFLNG